MKPRHAEAAFNQLALDRMVALTLSTPWRRRLEIIQLAEDAAALVKALPEEEVRLRWESTTEQWPMMNAVLHGVSRDQMMARHKANHIQVVYAPDAAAADHALAAKAAMFHGMGIRVHLCGNVNLDG